MRELQSALGIEVPDGLSRAYDEDRLVLFCGAGISVPEPSCLPNFVGLVRDVVATVARDDIVDDQTQLDVLLGDLDREKVPVHRLVAERIESSGRHNALHTHLVRIAHRRTPRIVTTNFDQLLESAESECGLSSATYVAPALPQGDDFEGIVHLHGLVPTGPGEAVVLTDRDFGRAYVTRGWATDFLERTFEKYVVLFVGYSASDPMLRYFARSVNAGGNLFALSSPSVSSEVWASIGAHPVYYQNDTGDHEMLASLLERWCDRGEGSATERYDAITQIALSDPPTDPLASDELVWKLGDPEYARPFLERAAPEIWLPWLRDHKLTGQLFGEGTPVEPESALWDWARWVTASIQVDGGDMLAAMCAEQNAQVTFPMWFNMWSHLNTNYSPTPTQRSLVALVMMAPTVGEFDRKALLLESLATADPDLAQFILRRMLDAKLVVTAQSGFLASRPVNFEVKFQFSPDFFEQAWSLLLPLLDEPIRLLESALSRIADSDADISVLQSGGAQYYISHQRPAVDDDDQSRADQWDFVISVARDLLRNHTRQVGSELAFSLVQRKSELLQRLGFDALANHDGLDQARTLHVLVDTGALFIVGLKPEAFAALARSFPSANDSAKREVIEHIQLFDSAERSEIRDYERYNLLVWLNEQAQGPEVAAAFAAHQTAHPEYAPRPKPDRNWWSGGAFSVPPYEAQGLFLTLEPQEVIDALLRDPSLGDPWDAETPLAELTMYLEQRPGQLLELVRILAQSRTEDAGIWSRVLSSLDIRTLELWAEFVVAGIAAIGDVEQLSHDLYALVTKETKNLSLRESARRERFAFQLWEKVPDGPAVDTSSDQTAILTSAKGLLATAFLGLIIGAANRRQPRRLTATSRRQLRELVEYAHAIGGPTVAAVWTNAFSLIALEPGLFSESILPMFETSSARAPFAWNGFLRSGSWSEALREVLEEPFRRSFGWVRENVRGSVSRFLEHHAYLFASQDVSARVDWADPFYLAANESERTSWLREVGQVPGQIKDPKVWLRLDRYWDRRLRNLPAPLSSLEQSALYGWLGETGEYFTDAAKRFSSGPSVSSPGAGYFHVNLDDLPTQSPAAVGAVMLHLVRSSPVVPYFVRQIFDHCYGLLTIDPDLARNIAEELLRRNYTPARELLRQLDDS